jgi:hypothetical protein
MLICPQRFQAAAFGLQRKAGTFAAFRLCNHVEPLDISIIAYLFCSNFWPVEEEEYISLFYNLLGLVFPSHAHSVVKIEDMR